MGAVETFHLCLRRAGAPFALSLLLQTSMVSFADAQVTPSSAAGPPPAGASPSPPTVQPTQVSDAMLAPIAPAPRIIGSWAEARSLLQARSTDLVIAYAEVRRAEAQSRSALASVLPTVTGSLGITHQFLTRGVATFASAGTPTDTTGASAVRTATATTAPRDFFSGSVTARQSIVDLQAWHQIGTAHLGEEAQHLAAAETQRSMALGLATSIVGVVAAERVAELNRLGLRTAIERRDITARKKGLGVGTGLDVVRSDQDVTAARATLVGGDESLRQAREALALAVGLGGQVGVSPNIRLDDVLGDTERACPQVKDLADRADLAGARARLQVAERNIRSVELSFAPTLSAQSALSATTSANATSPQTTWNVQGVLSIPIWDGGNRYGLLRADRALRDEATAQLEATRRQAALEVEQSRRSIEVAEQTLEVAQQARAYAEQVDQLTQTGFRMGQGTSLELVVASANVRQAQIELVLREFDVVRARLTALFALARCSGGT